MDTKAIIAFFLLVSLASICDAHRKHGPHPHGEDGPPCNGNGPPMIPFGHAYGLPCRPTQAPETTSPADDTTSEASSTAVTSTSTQGSAETTTQGPSSTTQTA